jgi:hypothetical protein
MWLFDKIVGMPFLLTLIVATLIYGIALTLVATLNTVWPGVIVMWLTVIFATIMSIRRQRQLLREKDHTTGSLLLYVTDLYIVTVHALAALGYSIFLIDSDYFTRPVIPIGNAFSIYVADFLHNTVLIFNSAGVSNLFARNGAVVPALWYILVSVSGVELLGFLLASVLNRQFKSIDGAIVPNFVAEYGAIQSLQQSGKVVRRTRHPGHGLHIRLPK